MTKKRMIFLLSLVGMLLFMSACNSAQKMTDTESTELETSENETVISTVETESTSEAEKQVEPSSETASIFEKDDSSTASDDSKDGTDAQNIVEQYEDISIEITNHVFTSKNSLGSLCVQVNPLIQICSGISDEIKNRINASLQDEYDQKLSAMEGNIYISEAWEETVEEVDDYVTDELIDEYFTNETWFYTIKCHVSYQDESLLCICYEGNWWMGGVHNIWNYGFTFDLTSGELLGIRDLIDGTDEEIETKIVDSFNEQYPDYKDEYASIRNIRGDTLDLDTLDFYIEDENIVICFGTSVGLSADVQAPVYLVLD